MYEQLFLSNSSKINQENINKPVEEKIQNKEKEDDTELEVELNGNPLTIIVKPVISNDISATSSYSITATEAADFAAAAAASAADAVVFANTNNISAAIAAANKAATYAANAAIKASAVACGNTSASDYACKATASARKANNVASKYNHN